MKDPNESPAPLSLVEIPEKLQSGHCYRLSIGIGDQIDPHQVVTFATEYKLCQIVQTSNHDRDLELKTSELMIQNPTNFLEFPVASIFDPANTSANRENELRVFSRVFRQANEKRQLISDLRGKVFEISNSESITDDVALAADELFTNAVFNAPHVAFSNNGPGAPRTSEYGESDSLRPAEIFIAHNNNRLILGCIDSYGSLNPQSLLQRLKTCFDQGASASINMGSGGAGLGTYLLFQAAASLYVGVSANRRTVVCCAYSLERRARVRAAMPKNIHVCLEEL